MLMWMLVWVLGVAAALAGGSGCADQAGSSKCSSWAASGYCAAGWEFDSGSSGGLQAIDTYYCAKTCGTCTPSSTGGHLLLAEHNRYRDMHGASALAWSDELASSAQGWADGCVFQHDSTGENLAASGGSSAAAAISSSITNWYNEIAQYDFSNPGFSEATGHFTQVVWLSSSTVGCASVDCSGKLFPSWPNPQTYVVCKYLPPGNVLGEFEQNVLPAQQ